MISFRLGQDEISGEASPTCYVNLNHYYSFLQKLIPLILGSINTGIFA